MKFGRTYELRVQGASLGVHIIRYPLTLKFNVERHNYSGANTARLSLYGLSESSRNDIFFDWFIKPTLITCTLNAGYESEGALAQIFSGNVNIAYTERQGPELVTHIEALDGGFAMATGKIALPLKSGTSFQSAVTQAMTQGLPGVKTGHVIVTPTPPPFSSDVVLNGKTWEELQKYIPENGSMFIDGGVANMLGQHDSLPALGGIAELSSATGLLGVPKKYGYRTECSCLFEPSFKIGQRINLVSSLNKRVNGPYTVTGIHHSGTISGVESGDAITNLTLLSTKF